MGGVSEVMEQIAAKLKEWTGGEWYDRPSGKMSGVSNDTRELKEGELFVALRTEKADGHEYLRTAKERGAWGALVERVDRGVELPQLVVANTMDALQWIARRYRLEFKGRVVGVTGSCGKTTTKDMLGCILGSEETHKTAENLNNLLGVPLTLVGIDLENHRYAVVEAGMNQPGEMGKLGWMIEADIGVVSVVAPAHLERLGRVEDVAWEKSLLLRGRRRGGAMVFPSGCLKYYSFRELAGEGAFVTRRRGEEYCGMRGVEDVVYDFKVEGEYVRVEVENGGFGKRGVRVRRMSEGMLYNMVSALTVSGIVGVDDKLVEERMRGWGATELRGEVRERGGQRLYVDCYNANPVAVVDAFKAFDGMMGEEMRRLYILGCMGELGVESGRYHEEVGRQLRLREGDRVFVRGFDEGILNCFIEGMKAGGANAEQIEIFRDNEEAKRALEGFEGAVFIKGSKAYKLWSILG